MNTHMIRNLLVPALLSGEYKQGQGRLRGPAGEEKGGSLFCCLGVAVDVAHKAGLIAGEWEEATNSVGSGFGNSYLVDGESCGNIFLPPVAREFYGLSSDGGLEKFGEKSLMQMNDDDNDTFEAIAEVLLSCCDLYDEAHKVEEGDAP